MKTETNLTLEDARKFYSTATGDFKSYLISKFTEDALIPKPKKQESSLPTTFAECCLKLGTTEESFNVMWTDVKRLLQEKYNVELSENTIAYEKLKMICKVLNTDENGCVWSPDPDSTTEQRWFPYFYFTPFRFGDSSYHYENVWTSCGLCLCSKSKSVANFFGTHFTKEWEEFLKK
jgi:hypothetical protein